MTSPTGSASTTPSEEKSPSAHLRDLGVALGRNHPPAEPEDLGRWLVGFLQHPIWDTWLRPKFEYEIAKRLEMLTNEKTDDHLATRCEVRVYRELVSTILSKAASYAEQVRQNQADEVRRESVDKLARYGSYGPPA